MKVRGAIVKVGAKDRDVYFEIWDSEDTNRVVDTTFSPEVAYAIGKGLVDNAIRQGYKVRRGQR